MSRGKRGAEPVLVHDLRDWKIQLTRIWPDATFTEDTDLQLVIATDEEVDEPCGTFNVAAGVGRIDR